MMKNIKITLKQIDEKIGESVPILSLQQGEMYTIQIVSTQNSIDIIEMEDAFFRRDSAVFLPDGNKELDGKDSTPTPTQSQEAINGIDVLKAVILYCNDGSNSAKRLLIAGHTDTTAGEWYNFKLSEMRALSAVYLFSNDKEKWVRQFKQEVNADGVRTHRKEDRQHILQWASRIRRWNCDPGSIDGIVGTKTDAAVKEFKKAYNGEFNGSLPINESFSGETWGAVFDLYQDELRKTMDADENKMDEYRRGIQWQFSGDSKKNAVGCGEKWPLDNKEKDNYRSRTNRRIEMLLFDPSEMDSLPCHDPSCAAEYCGKPRCPIYGEVDGLKKILKKYIPVKFNAQPVAFSVEVPPDSYGGDMEFTLFSTDESRSYSKTVKMADGIAGDGCVTVTFKSVLPQLLYSMTVTSESLGIRYCLFKNIPYTSLM